MELCLEHGMSDAPFCKWWAEYGGMDASMISRMKVVEDENRRLKKMFAELSMQNELLKETLGKNKRRDVENGIRAMLREVGLKAVRQAWADRCWPLRRPCADRGEKRVTYGNGLRKEMRLDINNPNQRRFSCQESGIKPLPYFPCGISGRYPMATR